MNESRHSCAMEKKIVNYNLLQIERRMGSDDGIPTVPLNFGHSLGFEGWCAYHATGAVRREKSGNQVTLRPYHHKKGRYFLQAENKQVIIMAFSLSDQYNT